MSVNRSNALLRWLVPAGAAIAMIAGGTIIKAVSAAADTPLPPRTAAQLLVDVQTARLDGLSGTVTERANLGLPALPGLGGQGSSDLTSLISGTHTLRVWYSGPNSVRVALLGQLGESDVITNGHDVWTWASRTNTATHRTLPASTGKTADKPDAAKLPVDPAQLPKTPQEAANAALAAIDPSTVVTTAGSARVAGRPAYELVLAPRDSASLVGQVRIAIDAQQHVPTRVQVFARNAVEPALEVAFTQVSFTRPGDEQFKFNPPPGAKVTEEPAQDKAATPEPSTPDKPSAPKTAVLGKGWATVVVTRPSGPLSLPGLTGGSSDSRTQNALLRNLPAVSGAWGSGHVLGSSLFSVLLTDDGRVLVGAVSVDRLIDVAGQPAAALKAGA
jgi:outer membrane lipoprotein-sorting protein